MTKQQLADAADAFEIEIPDRRKRDAFVEALASSKKAKLEPILSRLKRDDLKSICRELGLDDSGRKTADIVARLSGQEAKAKKQNSSRKKNDGPDIISYRHLEKRKNNPQVGMVTSDSDPAQPKTTWAYDPHIDPALQFDVGRAGIERLIDDALASDDQDTMRQALEALKKQSDPYLNWAGKAERTSFDVDTVSLHVHERIDPATIISAVRNGQARAKEGKNGGGEKQFQMGLFSAPFENLPLRDAIDFYQHEKGWSNRLIAGDSLLVMNSLLQKESMSGKVQMIFIDPPYGVRYGSNFQPFVHKRDVKDRSDFDLTQEPEMVKAFRDTWELGLHSYLTYLRDRLVLAEKLLTQSGSVFLQISDENLHHVRELMDDVLGAKNFVSLVAFRKTSAVSSPTAQVKTLATTCDYVLWYAKDVRSLKYNQLYLPKQADTAGGTYSRVEFPSGERRRGTKQELANSKSLGPGARVFRLDNLTSTGWSDKLSQPVSLDGETYSLPGNLHWKTTPEGMKRLVKARRVEPSGSSLAYVRYIDDFPVYPLTDIWLDTGTGSFTEPKSYVVQTNTKVVQRCLLMTTDPGDLAFDPTCGSGTTALVAETWGRRWVTCDTSRVAISLAKQRLMTASFDYYSLKHPHEGLRGGFDYRTVPHVTLRSIANNPELDEIDSRFQERLEACEQRLREAVPKGALGRSKHIPWAADDSWSAEALRAHAELLKAREEHISAISQSVSSHAAQEILFDSALVDSKRLRISGPFSVEAVPFPSVKSLDAPVQNEADSSIAREGESARQHSWRDELLKTGIRGKGGQRLEIADLETLPDTRYLHSAGTVSSSGERVVVSFGPEHAALEQRQVEMAIREAGELFPLPKMIVFCAFAFDPEAAKDIDSLKGITALKAQMNTDLLTEDLKKKRSSNQSFWLMGQPDVEVKTMKGGLYQVEVNGFDYFDTKTGELVSGGKNKIAAWMLDQDYDERSLFPHQVFFPMAGKKDGWYRLKKDIRAELDESLLDKFHGTVSLPFEPGENKKVAVKIVDDRGIESLKIIPLH